VLRDFLETAPTSVGPWLFCAPASQKYPGGGHQISTKRLNEDFLGLLRKVGLKAGRDAGFTIHSLRHAFETICVNAGTPQRAIDTWLGHRSDRSMASIYYRLTDEESQRFMRQVPFGLDEPAAKAGD
jgi:integrase